jgi:hypothetical protein
MPLTISQIENPKITEGPNIASGTYKEFLEKRCLDEFPAANYCVDFWAATRKPAGQFAEFAQTPGNPHVLIVLRSGSSNVAESVPTDEYEKMGLTVVFINYNSQDGMVQATADLAIKQIKERLNR